MRSTKTHTTHIDIPSLIALYATPRLGESLEHPSSGRL